LICGKKTLSKFKTEEEAIVRGYLENHIKELQREMETSFDLKPIDELERKYVIKDFPLLINSSIVLGIVIVVFFTRTFIGLDLTLAWVAIIGSVIHIIVSRIKNIDEILEKVELSTLLFFACLFIIMKCMEEMGLIEWIGTQIVDIISMVPEGRLRQASAILLILWVSAISSAFIDNIPYAATMAPVIVKLADSGLGLPLSMLVWALVYGTCLGGNGTLIGASANVVAVGLCESEGYKIGFLRFLKIGAPIMILSTSVCMIYLLIANVLIGWY